ncbi:hypothetical protein ACE3MQ_19765 [Paenibacillus lentus]|uniref:hypothetical protein n=1 Tax=Paenibacillus lentus TaxID=1338368 RepID=UPI003646E751
MDLGDLIISIRVRADALDKGFEEAKRILAEQSQEAVRSASAMDELSESITKTASSTSTLDKSLNESNKALAEQGDQLKEVTAATDNLGSAQIEVTEEIKKTTKAMGEEANASKEVAKTAKEREQQAKKAAEAESTAAKEAAKAQEELKAAYTKVGATAGVVFAAIVAGVTSAVKAHNDYASVMKGFANQIKSTGEDVGQALDVMKELSNDGLISEADTAASIKNLVNYGFTVSKAAAAVRALKDTAVDNRQAHYSLGEAVKVTTEGIRMENSVLSDAAGVQKNIAKMNEDYAKSIGKKTDELTKAEKAEAIYQGIMEESAANMGRAAEYADELGGKQAMLDASTQKLSQAYGGALAPVMAQIVGVIQPVVDFLTEMLTKYPALTAAVTTFIGVLSLLVAGLAAVRVAMLSLNAAAVLFGTTMSALMLNPWILALTALAGVVAAVTVEIHKSKEATKELKAAQEELQQIKQNGIDEAEIQTIKLKREELEKLILSYEKLIEVAGNSDSAKMGNNVLAIDVAAKDLGLSLEELSESAGKFGVALEFIDENGNIATVSMEKLTEAHETYNKAIKDASKPTMTQINDSAKAIAQRSAEVQSIRNLVKQYDSAEKGSSDWLSAQNELAKQFPQYANSLGINKKAIEGMLLVKEREIELEWQQVQALAASSLEEKNNAIAKQEAAIKHIQAAVDIAVAQDKITAHTIESTQRLAEMNAELAQMRGEAEALQAVISGKPQDVYGVAPVTPAKLPSAKKEKTSKAYENKALTEAYKQLEHKKKLDQLTLESELKMLQEIQTKHIKTADERMEIEERIYDVRKAMGDASLAKALDDYEKSKALGKLSENDEIIRLERIKKLYADSAEERKQIDDMIFDANLRKVEAEKQLLKDASDFAKQQLQADYEDKLAREELSNEEILKLQSKLIEDQIWINRDYLNKVLADDRYTAAEKKAIEQEITEEIRKQTNERLRLAKEYNKQQIDEINNLSKGIQDALKAKYQEEKKAAEDRIKDELQANENWKKAQLESIKSVYEYRVKAAQDAADAEIEQLNKVFNAQIAAIQAELDALEQAEKQKSRAELDAEDAKKIASLTAKIEYEHDDFNRIQLQKELNKVLAAQEKRHQEEQLEDKKEALKTEQQQLQEKLKQETDAIKQQLVTKKEIMAEEYQAQQDTINAIYAAQKASLDQQLLDTQTHYNKLLEAKALQAEAEKMIIQNQQEEILELLEGFGDSYNITGQTLGEKMYQGFKEKVEQIRTLIAEINSQIDAARSAAVSAMNTAVAAASASAGSSSSGSSSGSSSSGSSSIPVVRGTVVSVSNTFSAPVTSPSDISRATTKSAQQLAMKL